MARAIAYVRDIVLGRSDEVLARAGQTGLIKQFAADNEVEVVAWFEDEACDDLNVLDRPGLRALLAYDKPYDKILCERSWALSRSMTALEPFFKELERRGGVQFESATSAWDRVSQQCRRRSRSLPPLPKAIWLQDKSKEPPHYHVAKPARLNFVNLVHPAPSLRSPRL